MWKAAGLGIEDQSPSADLEPATSRCGRRLSRMLWVLVCELSSQ
jgi:hypothetical protein